MHGFEFPELKANSNNNRDKNESITRTRLRVPIQEYDKSVLVEPEQEKEVAKKEEYENHNPYYDQSTTNPFVEYDDVENVISSSDTFEEPILPTRKTIEDEVEKDFEDSYDEEEYYDEENEPSNEEDYEDEMESSDEEEVEDSNQEEQTEDSEEDKVFDHSFKTLYKEIKEENEIINRQKKERRKDLKLAFVVFMTIVLAGLIILNAIATKETKPIIIDGETPSDKDKPKPDKTIDNINLILDGLYNSGKTIDLENFLKDNYSNVSTIVSLEQVVNNKIATLLADLKDKEYRNYDEFSSEYDKTSSFIENVNNTTYKDVRTISEESYESFKSELEQLSIGSKEYYEGVASYLGNDFNNAYNSFKSVTSDSLFYDRAEKKIESIYQDIVSMIETDITTMLQNIDTKTEEEQKVIYTQVRTIIEKYGKAYSLVGITEYPKYQELLEKYTNLSL